MKRDKLLVVFVLVFLVAATACFPQQDFWEQTAARPGVEILSLALNSNGDIFAGTYDGGVFRSTDAGTNWEQKNSGLTNLRVWAIVTNSSGDLFVGTSESKVFRSVDNGDNWNQVFVDKQFSTSVDLAINSDGIIFASYLGLVRSQDNGDNWTAINTGLPSVLVNDIAINSMGHLFIGTSDPAGVFRSTDNGDNWTNVSNGLPNASIFSLGINSDGQIFVGNIDGQVFLSTDEGENWNEVKSLSFGSIQSIAINSDQHIFLGTGGDGVFQSTDNGNQWTQINDGLTDFNWIVPALIIDTSGIIFAGTEQGGVFRSKETTTSVDLLNDPIPQRFSLEQNYPNPFNPETVIRFQLPEASQVVLKIYNAIGQEIRALVLQRLDAGEYRVTWDGRDSRGLKVKSGVYFYRIQAGIFTQVKEMTLIR